jgi:hypothetical protein
MYMSPEDKKGLSIMQQYVMHLRYRFLDYQLEGIDPPEYLFTELAETLVQIDLKTKNS